MKVLNAARAHARALSGVVCGVALVGVAAVALPRGERLQAAPVAAGDVAGLTSAPAPAWSGGTVSTTFSGARLVRVNDVSVPSAPGAMTPFAGEAVNEASRTFQCLSTAIYYEARGEGADGMAAVAQVILNRARHPAFPRSVCGVVYQARQFSFVGAGLRAPYGPLWAQAREIAERALDGHVMTRVGTSTHFHATRVSPSWPGMRRVATIGQHIFYAYAGARGAASAFRAAPDLDGDAPAPARRDYARVQRDAVIAPTAPAQSATASPAPSTAVPADDAAPMTTAPAPTPVDAPLSAPAPVA